MALSPARIEFSSRSLETGLPSSSSRRAFLQTGVRGLSLSAPLAARAETRFDNNQANDSSGLEYELRSLFSGLPGQTAYKIYAPATKHSRQFLTALNSGTRLFTASANKAFIACERLRQLDAPDAAERLLGNRLPLDQSIWTPGSTVFDPPALRGIVNERTAMEAMVSHSDNTGTDIVLKAAGAANVRQFISSAGLSSTMIPDSIRAFNAYVFGAPNYLTITWDEIVDLIQSPLKQNPGLNNVQSLASSADDLVSFYSRALQGEFFQHRETLGEFRRILSIGDITYRVPFPLGSSVFGKAGYFDLAGDHGHCIAGGLYFPNRWLYFAMILNWSLPDREEIISMFYRSIRKAIQLVQSALTDRKKREPNSAY